LPVLVLSRATHIGILLKTRKDVIPRGGARNINIGVMKRKL
jgi:hypothetical protein